MKFAEPWWLLLAPLAAVLLPLLFWLHERARRRLLQRFARPATLSRVAPPRPELALLVRRALTVLAAVMLALALARPQWGKGDEVVRRRGLDVVFVLDASQSMAAATAPGSSDTRLDAARRAVSDLLELLHGDRTALVVFAGDAQVLCPLTIDDGALRMFLDAVTPDFLPTPGSDLAVGVEKALTVFPGKERQFKVLILLSDGEDTASVRGEAAARRARERGVVLHAIGFGSPEGEPIPLRDERGRPTGYKKDREGHVVSTRLDEKALRAMSETTAGIYVPARAGDRGLKSIADATLGMERRELESKMTSQLAERVEWPLLACFLLLAAETLVSLLAGFGRAPVLAGTALLLPREPRREPATAEPSPPAAARRKKAARVVSAALLLVLLPARPGRAASPASLARNGEEAFAAGRFDEASERFREALAADPSSPLLHYNLGTALLQAGKSEEAIQELSRAIATGPPEIQEKAHYNLGNAYYQLGKKKEALEEYRKSLRLAAGDRDAKHNYELALAQAASPPPTPTPSPSPQPSPSPSPSPSASPSPSPGEGEQPQDPGQGSPSPSPSDSPSPGEGEGEPTPAPGEAEPSPAEGMSKEQAERLLDALAQQEALEKQREKKKPERKDRVPLKDW